MSYAMIALFSLLLPAAHAEKSTATQGTPKARVIDLGQEATQSNVRQSNLKIVESESSILQILPEVFQRKFRDLEDVYLRPRRKAL